LIVSAFKFAPENQDRHALQRGADLVIGGDAAGARHG